MTGSKLLSCFASVFFLCSLFSGCEQHGSQSIKSNGLIVLNVWAHAGQEAERKVLQAQVERFNALYKKNAVNKKAVNLKLTFIPERDYNSQVQAAALAGDLPDVLEFDGPYLFNYIWQGHLLILDDLLPQSLKQDLLPSIVDQGTYHHHLYAVGIYDSGLGLYARKSLLQAIKARIPNGADDAWTVSEFNDILRRLSQMDKDKAVLDLKLNYRGEWYTYGFSPVLQSAGADLIERKDYQHSTGILNSIEAVTAMQEVQRWIMQGLVDPNLDDAAFTSGRVALSWAGHWEYQRYHKAFPDDLLVLPLPNFGKGSRTGQGSWVWGITKKSQHPKMAVQFLQFLLKPAEVLAMSNANGAVPGTETAVEQSSLYSEHSALRLFANQLIHGISVPRPKTPAYPVITTQFQNAFQQIRNGTEVKEALDTAAQHIDQDIRDNHGYPFNKDP